VQGYKPSPWHFRGFERLTRVARVDWIHVSSSVYHDIAPARTLGIRHVWLDREEGHGEGGEGDGGEGDGSGLSVRVLSAREVGAAVERLHDRAGQGALACC
jgi:hypothetical protein